MKRAVLGSLATLSAFGLGLSGLSACSDPEPEPTPVVDAGPPDSGMVCGASLPSTELLGLTAVAEGDQVALAWVPRGDESLVASYEVGGLAAAGSDGCAVGKSAGKVHTALLSASPASVSFRAVGLAASGRFAVSRAAPPTLADGGFIDGGLGAIEGLVVSKDVVAIRGDGGFQPPVPAGRETLDSPAVVALDSARQIVAGRAGNTLAIRLSEDRGASFRTVATFSSSAGIPRATRDAANGAVHVCWAEVGMGTVTLASSTTEGRTWTTRTVSGGVASATSSACDVAAFENHVAVAFERESNDAIVMTTNRDGFASATVVATVNRTGDRAYRPSVAHDRKRSRWVVAFDMPQEAKGVTGALDVQVVASTNLDGNSFGAARLAYEAANTKNKDLNSNRLAIDPVSGRMHVVYVDPVGGAAYSFSDDLAVGFASGSDLILGQSLTTKAESPDLALAPDGTVWFGFRSGPPLAKVPYLQRFDPKANGNQGAFLGTATPLGGLVKAGGESGPHFAFDPFLSSFAVWTEADGVAQLRSRP